MTLIGAFRSNGVPTLIGDFLTTVSKGRGPERQRKKIWRVTPQLAVAWTGPELDAGVMARHLDTRYRCNAVAGKAGLEEALATCEPLRKGLHLIGWAVEDGSPECFK